MARAHSSKVNRAVQLTPQAAGEDVTALAASLSAAAAQANSQAARGAMQEVREVLDRHIRALTGPEGLFRQIEEQCPRLAPQIERLAGQHQGLSSQVSELEAYLAERDGADPQAARQIQQSVAQLLAAMDQCHHGTNEVVLEAYYTDIGGE